MNTGYLLLLGLLTGVADTFFQGGNISHAGVLSKALVLYDVVLVFFLEATSGDTMYAIEDLVTGSTPMLYPSDFGLGTVFSRMIDSNPVLPTLVFTWLYRLAVVTPTVVS